MFPVIAMGSPPAHKGSSIKLLGLVHSKEENEVPVKNSELFYEALQTSGIKSKMLTYEKGRHGYGLGRADAADWPGECLKWLADIGVIASGGTE